MKNKEFIDCTHKAHARFRQTVCKIKYDNVKVMVLFFKKLRGHWRLVTCKNCLGERKNYEKSLTKIKTYKIKYLGKGHTIDIIEAMYPKEAIKKLLNPRFFVAEEIR